MPAGHVCSFVGAAALLLGTLAGCALPAERPEASPRALTTQPRRSVTETPKPSVIATRTSVALSSPSPSLDPAAPSPTATATLSMDPSPVATSTLLPGRAPALPRLDAVQFITHGARDTPLVAMTFDVGQEPRNPAGFDEGIYAALIADEAPATFFLGGDWMRTHIAETRLLDAEPRFELGNHSWSHPDMRTLDEPAMARELLRTQDMLYQITGHQTNLFRLPAGLYNDLALSVAAYHGLYVIQWDVVVADPVPDNSAENILRLVKERVNKGSIIVMHANGRGWHTAEALPSMIEYLRSEGYCLVTVSQLIGFEPVPPGCPATGFEIP